jgi:hypothetical protein
MPELKRLQESFAAALESPTQTRAEAGLFQGKPEDVAGRLALYRGNLFAAAKKALGLAFPITVKIIGAEFFEGLAREYVRRYPSVSGDLNEYGEALPRFVAEFAHTQDLPYLPDVTRMEWLAHRAYYAQDAQSFDLVRLASISGSAQGELHPVLAPACALLESRWPVARIWQVHQDDYAGEFSVDFDAGPERILISRPLFRVEVTSVSAGAFRFLQGAQHGASIAQSLDAALVEEPDFDFAIVFPTWVKTGVIVGLEHFRTTVNAR